MKFLVNVNKVQRLAIVSELLVKTGQLFVIITYIQYTYVYFTHVVSQSTTSFGQSKLD